jgi:tetratricopeptide (TPR) repeat protein
VVLSGLFVANRVVTGPLALATQTAAARALQLRLSTRTPAPIQSAGQPQGKPTSVAEEWFVQAQELLDRNRPQDVLDLLRPKIDQMTNTQDRADAYDFMGQAEFQLRHYQLAAVHFSKLQELQPSREHLFTLAYAYDMGGDLERALASYAELVDRDGYVDDDYYFMAVARVKELGRIVATPTPKRY